MAAGVWRRRWLVWMHTGGGVSVPGNKPAEAGAACNEVGVG